MTHTGGKKCHAKTRRIGKREKLSTHLTLWEVQRIRNTRNTSCHDDLFPLMCPGAFFSF